MERICSACLSVDRKLFILEDLRYFYDLLTPDTYDLHSFRQVTICWECRNTLRKCKQFERNSMKAKDFLISCHLELSSYDEQDLTLSQSTLSTSLQTDFDFKYTYDGPFIEDSSCPPRIKQESDPSPRCENQEPDQSPCSIKLESDTEIYEEPLIRAKSLTAIDRDEYSQTSCRIEQEAVVETYDEPLLYMKLEDGLPNIPTDPLSEATQNVVIQPLLQSLEATLQNSDLVQSYQMPEPLAKQPSVTKLTKSAPEQTQLTTDQKKENRGPVARSSQRLRTTQVISKALEPNEPVAKNVNDKKYGKCYGRKLPNKVQEMPAHELEVPENIETPTTQEIYESFLTTLPIKYKKSFKITLRSETELKIHREKMSKEPQYVSSKYKCTDCIVGFDTEQQLEDHRTTTHTKRAGVFQCKVCKFRLTSRMSLRAHMARHFVVCACTLCSFEVRNVRAIRAHYREAHGSGLRLGKPTSYTCGRCKENFASVLELQKHMTPHRGRRKNDQFMCGACSLWCKDLPALNCHSSFVHGIKGVKKPQCPTHKEEGCICDICGKWFKDLAALKLHYNSEHGLQVRIEPLRRSDGSVRRQARKCQQYKEKGTQKKSHGEFLQRLNERLSMKLRRGGAAGAGRVAEEGHPEDEQE